MPGPLGQRLLAVGYVTAERVRNNLTDEDTEQQTLTQGAKITGSQPWPLGVGGGRGIESKGEHTFVDWSLKSLKRKAASFCNKWGKIQCKKNILLKREI